MILNDNKLEFDKVVSKIGFPISFEDYRATYKYDANIDTISEFENKLRNNMGEDYNTVLNIIKSYKDIFDTELYLFHIGKYLEKDYKASKESEILKTKYYPHLYYTSNFVRPTIATIDYYNNMLKNIDVVDLGINSKTGDIVIECSQELYGDKDILKNSFAVNTSKLETIKNKIGLKNVLKYLNIQNIIDFCRYENLGNYLAQNLKIETSKENDNNNYEKYEQIITKYIEYMDLDKMLIIANYFYCSKYNMAETYTEYEINELVNYTNKVEEIIDNKYDTIVLKTQKTLIGFQTVKSSVNTLKKCFINGVFYTIDKIKEMSKKLLDGEIKIETISNEIFRDSFSFTNSELANLLKDDYNFEYIFNNKYLTKDEILSIYESNNIVNKEEYKRLYNFDIINNDYLLKKYISDDIDIDVIKYIKEHTNKEAELEKMVSNYEFITLFLEESKSDFYKYQLLYKTLILDNKSEDEKNQIGYVLINQVRELLNDCKINDLYQLGLITKENFINNVSINSLINYFIEGKISAGDIRKLFDNNLITENNIKDFLVDESVEISKKVVFLYGLFPKEIDSNIRNSLLNQTIGENSYVNFEDEKLSPFKIKIFNEENNIWIIISKYENDFRQILLDNGYIIIYMPSKDLYIIKQVLNNNKMIYGSGIYIISGIEFNKNKELLIIDNNLNKTYLNSLYINNKLDKLVSTGWVNSLNRYLEMM